MNFEEEIKKQDTGETKLLTIADLLGQDSLQESKLEPEVPLNIQSPQKAKADEDAAQGFHKELTQKLMALKTLMTSSSP